MHPSRVLRRPTSAPQQCVDMDVFCCAQQQRNAPSCFFLEKQAVLKGSFPTYLPTFFKSSARSEKWIWKHVWYMYDLAVFADIDQQDLHIAPIWKSWKEPEPDPTTPVNLDKPIPQCGGSALDPFKWRTREREREYSIRDSGWYFTGAEQALWSKKIQIRWCISANADYSSARMG